MRLRLSLAIGLILLLAPSAPAQTARFAGARDRILQIVDSLGIPGVGIAVAKDGQILWEDGFGWADRERMVPVTSNTMFSLASISKPLTATGLMRLVARGQVQLDRPVNDYLGLGKLTGLAGDASGASVRRVLSHTAGLPLHYQFFYQTGAYAEPSMDETIARYGILVTPPGEVHEYSNLGYGILDQLIARVSGMPYADFMRTQVFLPLGMTRTSVHLDRAQQEFAAQRYDSRLKPIPFYDFDHDGGSAIWSSAHDLIRFGMFHLKQHATGQPRLLPDSAVDLMQRVATPGDTSRGYGLGWGIATDMGYRLVAHAGGMPGVATTLRLFPTERLAVAVLTNRSSAGAATIAQELVAAVLPRYADSLRVRRARREPPGRASTTFVVPAELAGAWRGTIRTWMDTVPFALTFQPDGDVHARIGGQLETLVNNPSWTDGRFAGRILATIPTDDARRHPHMVLLNLGFKDGRLSGAATALATTETLHFALTSYAYLSREK